MPPEHEERILRMEKSEQMRSSLKSVLQDDRTLGIVKL